MSTLDYNAELAAAGANVKNRWGAIRFFMRRYPLGTIGAVIMGVFAFAAIFAPYITYYDPLSTNASQSLARPSLTHWLGCDFMGRDVYSRIIYGARISLEVSIGRRTPRTGCACPANLLGPRFIDWPSKRRSARLKWRNMSLRWTSSRGLIGVTRSEPSSSSRHSDGPPSPTRRSGDT